jgi:hypothetical protein
MVAEAFGLKRKEAAAEEIPFDEAQSAGAILDDLLEV